MWGLGVCMGHKPLFSRGAWPIMQQSDLRAVFLLCLSLGVAHPSEHSFPTSPDTASEASMVWRHKEASLVPTL